MLVTFQTQVRGNILDLLLTNIPDRVSDVKAIGRLGKSDHTMVSFNVSISRKCEQTTEMFPKWHKANWSAIRTGLKTGKRNGKFWIQMKLGVSSLVCLRA